MKRFLFFLTLCLIIHNLGFIQTAKCCFSEAEIINLDLKKANEIFLSLEKLSEKERDKYFNCKIGIYSLGENILKSQNLSDAQKLIFYYKIFPLYPNNAELGSVLGFDTIKLFHKYKKQPIELTVNSINDSKTREYIREFLIMADMILE